MFITNNVYLLPDEQVYGQPGLLLTVYVYPTPVTPSTSEKSLHPLPAVAVATFLKFCRFLRIMKCR